MKLDNGQSLRFSNRELIAMLFPVIINDLTSILVNTVDSIMVSSTGEAAVSAISLVGTIEGVFNMFLITLGIGCTVVVSQHIGANQLEQARSAAKQAVYIGFFFALPIFVFLMIFAPKILYLVYPNTDPAVMENALVYYRLIILTLPFIGIEQMFIGTIRAMGKNRLILILGLARNLLNIAGNALLIYVFKMGVAGAAIASTASAIVCTFISYLLVSNKKLPVNIQKIWKVNWQLAEIKRILSIGLGTGLERCLLMFGKILVSSMYASLSAVAISAYSVSRTLCGICWTIVISFGTVLMTVVGQCIGADQPEQAKYYAKKGLLVTIPFCFLVSGILFLFRDQLVHIYDFSEETLQLASQYTAIGAILTAVCLYPMAILPGSAFRAAGDTRYVIISSTVITFLCQVGLCYLFVKHMQMGIAGVWLSMGIDWIFRVIAYGIRFRSGKWLTKRLV